MADRDMAQRLAECAPEDIPVLLAEVGVEGDDSEFDAILDAAASAMSDDPSIGARLAQLAHQRAVATGADHVVPRALYLLAQSHAATGDLATAETLIDEARLGFERLGRSADALRTNLGRTQVLNETGRHDDALAACRELLDNAHLLGPADDPAVIEMVAAAHQNSGLCCELTGRFETALEHYRSAEAGYLSTRSLLALAEVRLDRSLVYLAMGRHAQALATLREVAEWLRGNGMRALLATTLTTMAEVHLHRGEYQQCLDALHEARDASRDINAPVGDHVQLLVSAHAFAALNLLPESLDTYREALEFLQSKDLAIDGARARWGHGLVLARLGRLPEAERELEAAFTQFERSGQPAWLAEILLDRARVAQARGDRSTAGDLIGRAAATATKGSAAEVRVHLAAADNAPIETRLALATKAAESAEKLGLTPLRAMAHHGVATALVAVGDLDGAEARLLDAIADVERLRGGIDHELVRMRFLDDKRSPYEDLLAVRVANDAPADRALAVSEQAKSRTLNEIISGLGDLSTAPNDRAIVPDPEAENERHDAERRLTKESDLRAVQAEIFSGTVPHGSDRHRILWTRMRKLEADLDRDRIVAGPRSRHSSDVEPSGLLPMSVPAGEALISYACVGNAVHTFVVTSAGVERVTAIAPISSAAELDMRMRRQWGRFRVGTQLLDRHLAQLERSARSLLGEMHDRFFAPALALIGDATDLVIIPDGPLHDLPLHAFHDGDVHLSERFAISYAPSIAMFARLPPSSTSRATVAAGVSDAAAPLVEREVVAVAHRRPDARVFTGSAAVWEDVRSAMVGAAHVHLAGHAIYRHDNPMYSSIKLSDRWVTAAELLGLDLRGATVVLSACDSGRTEHSRHAEINGFVRGFLGAGASTVIASQWSADDAATEQLMRHLYEGLDRSGPRDALRRAQRLVSRQWPHPYFWAPWIAVARP